MFRVFAPAKINLCLHVTGQRADGYHLLDSLIGFADVGDVLEIGADDGGALTVTGPEAAALAGGENIIIRTLAAFGASQFGVKLTKILPVASGMGGGSTDAAAAYRGICALQMRGAVDADAALLLALGADVPMCAAALPARVQGIGEQITPLPNLARLPAVLVNPRVPVSTIDVFKALRNKNNPPLAALPPRLDQPRELLDWLSQQRNDLQDVAIALVPQIAKVLAALADQRASLARMSGSGASCFGLFENDHDAQRATSALRAQYPDWWVVKSAINGPIAVAPQAMRSTT